MKADYAAIEARILARLSATDFFQDGEPDFHAARRFNVPIAQVSFAQRDHAKRRYYLEAYSASPHDLDVFDMRYKIVGTITGRVPRKETKEPVR